MTTPRLEIRALDHLVLMVRDLEVMRRFYVDVLGMRPVDLGAERGGGEGRNECASLRFGAQQIRLHPASSEVKPRAQLAQPGGATLCLLVAGSLASWQAKLEAAWPILAGPANRDGATGPIESIFLHDPDGNLVELSTEAAPPELVIRDSTNVTYRLAELTRADAQSCLAIYRPIVEQSHHSFEVDVPSVEEFSRRIEAALRSHAWWLAFQGDRCVGYAYATAHRDRAAYQQACEVSAYVSPQAQREGIASQLYARLFASMRDAGKTVAYAVIALPHADSVAFHEKLGFRPFAHFPEAGRKFGRDWDVGWWRRPLN